MNVALAFNFGMLLLVAGVARVTARRRSIERRRRVFYGRAWPADRIDR